MNTLKLRPRPEPRPVDEPDSKHHFVDRPDATAVGLAGGSDGGVCGGH